MRLFGSMRGKTLALLLVAASATLPSCGGSTDDAGSAGSGGSAGNAGSSGSSGSGGADDCGPMPGGVDCYNPCTRQMHSPVCQDGTWVCNDPPSSECSECGPVPGGWDCVDPCTHQMHGPVCKNGSWTCDDPPLGECPDAAGCAAIGNLVPVSCEPFPATTACDPFGVWSLTYDVAYPGQCASSNIGQVVIERGSDGLARVGFGSTFEATLSEDGCELSVSSKQDWTNPSEYGTIIHALTLSFADASPGDGGTDASVPTAKGTLQYTETGFCVGSGTTAATAVKTGD